MCSNSLHSIIEDLRSSSIDNVLRGLGSLSTLPHKKSTSKLLHGLAVIDLVLGFLQHGQLTFELLQATNEAVEAMARMPGDISKTVRDKAIPVLLNMAPKLDPAYATEVALQLLSLLKDHPEATELLSAHPHSIDYFLRYSDDRTVLAHLLFRFSTSREEGIKHFIRAGAVPQLVRQLAFVSDASPTALDDEATALRTQILYTMARVSAHQEGAEAITAIGGLTDLVECILNAASVDEAVVAARASAATTFYTATSLNDETLVKTLADVLTSERSFQAPSQICTTDSVDVYVISTLCNLCHSCNTKHAVSAQGVIPRALNLLRSRSPDPPLNIAVPVARLMKALGSCIHVVGDVFAAGAVPTLMQLLPTNDEEVSEAVLEAVREMVRAAGLSEQVLVAAASRGHSRADIVEYSGQEVQQAEVVQQVQGELRKLAARAGRAVAAAVAAALGVQLPADVAQQAAAAAAAAAAGGGNQQDEAQPRGKCGKVSAATSSSAGASTSSSGGAGSSSSSHSSGAKECRSCGAYASAAVKLRLCAGCQSVRYCSPACQKRHWKEHKPQCLLLQGKAQGSPSRSSPTA